MTPKINSFVLTSDGRPGYINEIRAGGKKSKVRLIGNCGLPNIVVVATKKLEPVTCEQAWAKSIPYSK